MQKKRRLNVTLPIKKTIVNTIVSLFPYIGRYIGRPYYLIFFLNIG